MDIEFLRNIGHKLISEIKKSKPQLNSKSLGRGASGDMTYAIDKIAEDLVISAFYKEGISFNLIAEESGPKLVENSKFNLIIDPIDGSRNAISGIPFFSTSIAIADGATLESLKLGYIVNLINGDEFWAERDRGAYYNGLKINTEKEEKSIIVAFEASNPFEALKEILPLFKIANRVRCFGSTALDLAYLSTGSISIFITPTPSRIFDFSAGILIAKESGALITDIKGRTIWTLPVKFDTKTTLMVSKSNSLHKEAIALLS